MIAARQGIIAKQNNLVDITLYSSQGPTESDLIGYDVYYGTAECSGWSAWPAINNCPNNENCEQYGTLTTNKNITVYVTVRDCTGTFIQFNAADNTATCPANEGNYCWDYESCNGKGVFSFNSGNVNKNIAINVLVSSTYYGCNEAPPLED
jgi:hypothetical protein